MKALHSDIVVSSQICSCSVAPQCVQQHEVSRPVGTHSLSYEAKHYTGSSEVESAKHHVPLTTLHN